jgi:uncharacterized protein
LILENIMRNTGMMKNLVNSLKEMVGSTRVAAAVMPAVIGLLPSPGGARFSCPMVEEVVGSGAEGKDKAFVNYWFRHIWMDGFILYPGAILISKLTGITVISFFVHMLPFMTISVILGIIFGAKNIKKVKIIRSKTFAENFRIFSVSILPVVIVITSYLLLINIFKYSLEISILIVVIALFIIKKYNMKMFLKAIKEAFPGKLALVILGAMIFKQVLVDSGVMDGLPGILHEYGIPVAVLFLILPFIGGFSSGITVSYLSLTFPFLLPLGLDKNVWYPVLAFSAGYTGVMISPLHLCAIMSADYFKSPLGNMLVKVAATCSIMLVIIAVVLFLMIR